MQGHWPHPFFLHGDCPADLVCSAVAEPLAETLAKARMQCLVISLNEDTSEARCLYTNAAASK